MEVTDAVLIERSRNRDTDAFRQLVERYRREAYGFAYSYLRNADDAFLVSQEAFVRAWNAMRRFEAEREFRPWLFSIVKHLALNALDSKRRRREVSLDAAMEESGFDLAGDDPDPLATVEAKELRSRVWMAVMGLKPEFREVIVLKHFNEFTYREIAQALGIPEGTVMSRLYHARLALRERLADMSQGR